MTDVELASTIKSVELLNDKNANNDEAQAYLLSWIVEQVYKQFKK